jgi:superfamily II DNA helicase RecQ
MSAKSGDLPQMQLQAAKQMSEYLNTKKCHWQFLLNIFGFGKEVGNWRFGHCDNCRRYKFIFVYGCQLFLLAFLLNIMRTDALF